MKSLKILLFFVISSFFVASAHAATITVGGSPISNAHWTSDNIYYVSGSYTVRSGYTLTIDAGTIIKFAANQKLLVKGTLTANGTSGNEIIFTSVQDDVGGSIPGDTGDPARGDWGGVHILYSSSNASVLNYGKIRYGGYSVNAESLIFNASNATVTNTEISEFVNGIVITGAGTPTFSNNNVHDGTQNYLSIRNSSPTVQYNTISSGWQYGIMIYEPTNMTLTNNTITTTSFKIYYYYGSSLITQSNNTVHTNGQDDVYNLRSFDMGSINWGTLKSDRTIYFKGDVDLNLSESLYIPAGTIIKVDTSDKIEIRGNLQAIGTATNNIIFTSMHDNSVGAEIPGSTGDPAAGDWAGLHINYAGSNATVLDFVQIKYGGVGVNNESLKFDTSNATVRNSLITDSTYGVRTLGGNPTINSNIIMNSGNQGLYVASGTPTVTNNLFYNYSAPTYNYTLDGTNIVGEDPKISIGNDGLESDSPAINEGDISWGNHAVSGNQYDIGPYEFVGTYLDVTYGITLSNVAERSLTYTWSFVSVPGGEATPDITSATGSLSEDGAVSCQFEVTKLGDYEIQIVVQEEGESIGTFSNGFSVSN